MKNENLKFIQVPVIDKTKDHIVVQINEERTEIRRFMKSGQHDLLKTINTGDKVVAVLNEKFHDHIPGEGCKEHLEKIVVPGDPDWEETLIHIW